MCSSHEELLLVSVIIMLLLPGDCGAWLCCGTGRLGHVMRFLRYE